MPMEPQDVLRQILDKYGIKEIEIARRTGINQTRISRYINRRDKKDIQVGTLCRLVNALPVEAYFEFWTQMALVKVKTEDKEEVCLAE